MEPADSCQFCKNYQNTFLYHFQTAAIANDTFNKWLIVWIYSGDNIYFMWDLQTKILGKNFEKHVDSVKTVEILVEHFFYSNKFN